MDLHFWISLSGAILITFSVLSIAILLKKKAPQSHLLPTLGFDALESPLKAIYMRSAVWERKLSHFQSSSSLAREFRRALFELQLLNYPDPTPSTDLKALEKLIDTQPEDAEDCRKRLEHLKEFRKQKKRA